MGLTFKDFGIVLQEIEEYVNNVEPVPFPHKVASFPVKHPPNLQHPKSESRELLVRPEHIPEYLPLMRPDLEGINIGIFIIFSFIYTFQEHQNMHSKIVMIYYKYTIKTVSNRKKKDYLQIVLKKYISVNTLFLYK